MTFWFLIGGLTLLVAAVVLRPLVQRAPEVAEEQADVAIYKAQLAEVDRDLARGVLAPDEAERARTEVARRLLSAARSETGPATARPAPVLAVVAGAVVAAIAVATYLAIGAPGEPDQPLAARLAISEEMRANRPAQAALERAAPPVPAPDAPAEYLELVAELRAVLDTRPDDLRGWEMLAYHEAELRNYAAAWRAQANVTRIRGDAATVADWQQQLDLMVFAADGYVSPEAEALVRDILDRDEANIAARYHLGALYAQTDRADLAFQLWRPIAERAPDGFHTALARAQIEDAASRAGLRYALPEVRGPTAADIAAAEDMSPEDRAAMISGMIASLSGRLASEGGPPGDWAMLIRALGVAGDTTQAATIWTEAQAVFAGNADAVAEIRAAAVAAGVAE